VSAQPKRPGSGVTRNPPWSRAARFGAII